MNCPKCGTARQAEAVECSSCGVVFARWEQRRERPPVETPLAVDGMPEEAVHHGSVPGWLILTVVMAFLIFGLAWTKHSRKVRAEQQADADELINKINANLTKAQMARDAKMLADRRAELNLQVSSREAKAWPAGLSEGDVRAMIARCTFFNTPVGVSIPRSIMASDFKEVTEYGELLRRAEVAGLVSFDQPKVNGAFVVPEGAADAIVNVTLSSSAYTQADVSDIGNGWRLDVGNRKVIALTLAELDGSRAKVRFTWDVTRPVGQVLRARGTSGEGEFVYERSGAAWTLRSSSPSTGCS